MSYYIFFSLAILCFYVLYVFKSFFAFFNVLMFFTILAILVHDPTCDVPGQSVFERLAKSYYHTKIGRVMLNLTLWLMMMKEKLT